MEEATNALLKAEGIVKNLSGDLNDKLLEIYSHLV